MIDLSALTEIELLELHALVLSRLKEIGAVRSKNNPVADLAERLAAKLLGATLVAKSNRSYDLILSADGVDIRYEVKARRLTPDNGSRQLGALRGMDEKRFDYLAGILFDESFLPLKAAIAPWEVVKEHATYRPHVNAWVFLLRDSVWSLPGVRDLPVVPAATV
jgi:hypothetical protein